MNEYLSVSDLKIPQDRGAFETSVTIYHSTRRDIPKVSNLWSIFLFFQIFFYLPLHGLCTYNLDLRWRT